MMCYLLNFVGLTVFRFLKFQVQSLERTGLHRPRPIATPTGLQATVSPPSEVPSLFTAHQRPGENLPMRNTPG